MKYTLKSVTAGTIKPAFVTAYFTVWTICGAEVPQDQPSACAASDPEVACASAEPHKHHHLSHLLDDGNAIPPFDLPSFGSSTVPVRPFPVPNTPVSVLSHWLTGDEGWAPVVEPDQCAVTDKACANSDLAAGQHDQPHLHGENAGLPPTPGVSWNVASPNVRVWR
jgi:hypothetical protein